MSSNLKQQFEERGYVVIPGLLSPEEVARCRAEIQKLSGVGDEDYGKKVFECPDGISRNRSFWPIIYHDRLISTVRELLGPTVRYTQHSDIHAHRGAPEAQPGGNIGGWHRDSACRDFGVGPDWDESLGPYKIVRVAIYLQTFAESHSKLGVIPGSHRYEKAMHGLDRAFWSRALGAEYRFKKLLWRMKLADRPMYYHPWIQMRTKPAKWPLLSPPARPVWIRTEPGDCVIFSQRLHHAASPISGPKYAFYLSYSPEDEHARNHMRYYRFTRKDLKYGPLEPELEAKLRELDLYMDVPQPEAVAGFTVPDFAQSRL
jgi:ectoine hydroxylase-related dioxygenase (phytanoyl-CoA dioxygenase family)